MFMLLTEIWCLRPPWARRARLRLGLDCLCYTLNQRHRVHRCAAMASREPWLYVGPNAARSASKKRQSSSAGLVSLRPLDRFI